MPMDAKQMAGYTASQQKRYDAAYKAKDNNLLKRLTDDALSKGYKLNTPTAPAAPVVPKVITGTKKDWNNGFVIGSDSQSLETNKMQPTTYPGMLAKNAQNGSTTVSNLANGNNNMNNGNANTGTNTGTDNNNSNTAIKSDNVFLNPNELKKSAFNYDFTQDPQYLNALQTALNNAGIGTKKAQQQALESLNERGISNSSIAASQMQQIANEYNQQAQDSVNALIPKLMEQAYGRYQDNRDFTANKAIQEAGLTGMYQGKQTLANKEFILQQQKLDAEKARNARLDNEESRRWWATYEQEGKKLAQQNKLDWATLSQRSKEFYADQAWKEKNYNLDTETLSWQKDPNNPLNMQREATAQSKGSVDKEQYISDQADEFATKLDSGEMTYEDAMKIIQRSEAVKKFDPTDEKENKRIADEIRNRIRNAGFKEAPPTDWFKAGEYLSTPLIGPYPLVRDLINK